MREPQRVRLAVNVPGGGHMHAENGHQSPHVTVIDDVLGDHAIGSRQLVAQEVELPQAAVDGQALVDRQREVGEPSPILDPEGVGHRRTALEVAMQDRGDLVLDLVNTTNASDSTSLSASR
jgi:hypothetical protein